MSRLTTWCATGAGIAATVVTVGVVRSGANLGTTYAGTTWLAAAAASVAGIALFASVAFARRPGLAALGLFAGICWLASIAAGWQSAPPLLRATATAAAAFVLPLLLVTAVAAAGARPRAIVRILLAAAVGWTAFLTVSLAFIRDPFRDPTCWTDCQGNAFLIHPVPALASALEELRPWSEITLGCCALALSLAHRAGRGRADRVATAAIAAVGAAALLHGSTLVSHPLEDPFDRHFRAAFFMVCAASALVGLALATPALEVRLRRRTLGRVLATLGEAPAPDELEQALGRALSDHSLHVIFRVAETGQTIDTVGVEREVPAPRPSRAVTALMRGGEPLGWIEHDAAATDALRRVLTPAIRLTFDNARLRAGALAQLRELRAARRRIVTDGDRERRRLERDLHDGVQQQLLALAGEVRAAARAAAAADHSAADVLGHAVAEVADILEEVRAVAHGIYPAILTDAGLAAALASLADLARVPVELAEIPARRYPAEVEAAVYRLVAEAVDEAASDAAAQSVRVAISESDTTLEVCVRDDGLGEATPVRSDQFAEIADRIGALDGNMTRTFTVGGGTTIAAAIPCAS